MSLRKGIRVSIMGAVIAVGALSMSFFAKPVHANVLCNDGSACTYYGTLGGGQSGTCKTASGYCACAPDGGGNPQQQGACNAQQGGG